MTAVGPEGDPPRRLEYLLISISRLCCEVARSPPRPIYDPR
jgi:hypothetical protein